MITSESLQVTQLVTNLLDKLDILYVIGGSVASTIFGMPRMTMDVDIVVALPQPKIAPFVAGLSDAFYADEASIKTAVLQQTSFNLIHFETAFKVDMFVVKQRPFDQQQLARRRAEYVDVNQTTPLWVATPEDIILAKLEWFHLGGGVSERQWRDVLGVLKTQQSKLDVAYLRQWAAELNVVSLLEYALVEIDG
ncbi:MAG: hypothetical protein F6J89_33690 [Symploca sp. SIO1C4]|uniref:Nucleotidyltransferase family protein n=1 Tax=Symploca sp. SIO1C4 TaxID=2607765 RepID=A0A6B3NNB7_9CYAN|nr:hypothetical protein [Symploca sp. SIO1C4]